MALETIKVLKDALGVGSHDPIYRAPTFAVLALIDGKFGSHDPDYARFEGAILAAAREIVTEGSASDLPLFDSPLQFSPA
jgi:hypothetical protein